MRRQLDNLDTPAGEKRFDTALAGLALGPANSPLRRKLRSRISHLVREGFRRGFRRGCIESNKPHSKSKKRISYDAHRDFFDGRQRPVKVSWRKR
jgi:hypothetical protein